jgi:hypothetical protein
MTEPTTQLPTRPASGTLAIEGGLGGNRANAPSCKIDQSPITSQPHKTARPGSCRRTRREMVGGNRWSGEMYGTVQSERSCDCHAENGTQIQRSAEGSRRSWGAPTRASQIRWKREMTQKFPSGTVGLKTATLGPKHFTHNIYHNGSTEAKALRSPVLRVPGAPPTAGQAVRSLSSR